MGFPCRWPPSGHLCWDTRSWVLQGDRERAEGMPVSPLCDRHKVDVPKSQITFLEYVVRPTFEALRDFAPATAARALGNTEAARSHWERSQLRMRQQLSASLFPMDDV